MSEVLERAVVQPRNATLESPEIQLGRVDLEPVAIDKDDFDIICDFRTCDGQKADWIGENTCHKSPICFVCDRCKTEGETYYLGWVCDTCGEQFEPKWERL